MVGQSLVGKFGFMHIDMPDGFYRLWLVVGSISAVGVLSRGMRWKREPARAEVRADSSVWLLMSCAVVLAIVELVQFNLTISQPQGRLMAHVLPAMAIVLVAGWLESSLLVQRGVSKLWPNSIVSNFPLHPQQRHSRWQVCCSDSICGHVLRRVTGLCDPLMAEVGSSKANLDLNPALAAARAS